MTSPPRWIGSLPGAILVLGLALPSPLHGQQGIAMGRVVQGRTAQGLGGVALVATDLESTVVGRGLTRTAGNFVIELPPGGPYRIRANSMGFQDAVSDTFRIAPGDTLTLLPLEMAPQEPVPLERTVDADQPAPDASTEHLSGAVRAGAEAPERLKGIDPGTVTVAPVEAYRVSAHIVDGKGVDVLRHLVRRQDLPTRHLVHASGAAAVHPKVPGRIFGDMPVPPGDLQR